MRAQLAVVRPRYVSRLTGDSFLLADEIADRLKSGQTGVVHLVGLAGTGKTTALQHLAASFPQESRLVLLDVDEQPPGGAIGRRLIVQTAYPPTGQPGDRTLYLAPWGPDELREYLWAVCPRLCAEVMSKISAADISKFNGNPEIWRLILDELAVYPELADPREAVLHYQRTQLKDQHDWRKVNHWAFESYTGDPLTVPKIPLPANISRLARHAPLQRIFAARHAAEQLRGGGASTVLKEGLPFDLIQAAAPLIRDDAQAREQLERLLSDPQYRPMAASFLVQIDPDWKPAAGVRGRYNDGHFANVHWCGVDLSRSSFCRANLTAADLSGGNLGYANLNSTSLARANLEGAGLTGAVAWRANLTDAGLKSVDADHVNFSFADLTRADLELALLREANFIGANLTRTSLRFANLRNADFRGSQVHECDFTGADLTYADFGPCRTPRQKTEEPGVCLTSANFTGACLQGAKLEACDLEELQLDGVDLSNSLLYGAWLTHASLRGANLSHSRLMHAAMAEVDAEGADFRGADLRKVSFHMGSSRSGLVGSPLASEGTRTGFYTDELHEQDFKAPEEIRKANLRNAQLEGTQIEGTDFYLVDLRGATYSPSQEHYFRQCGAILHDRCVS